MFHKILVANRGEIAVRIIRSCMYMGIKTVAIYSEADQESLHVQLADEAVCIGPSKSKDSYLNMENIITAAINYGAEAIHPGFGFLSENPQFAELCETVGIHFIGPKSQIIALMGNKSKARETMIEAGVPVVPGSTGKVNSAKEGLKLTKDIGYPILIKASAGGGGRGMRISYSEDDFEHAFDTASSEALNAFGDGTMYLEKYIENPKHIEFQMLCDKYNQVLHLGERDCSLQRRNQKVIEEAPSMISESLRNEMAEAAIKACRHVQYENAGTIEFLVSNDTFYFIEMNTRIQVEHPVTEMITGIDIISEQIKIAAGEKLSYQQEDIHFHGHSIECRLNAENPKINFQPSPGQVTFLHVPNGPGVRFDSFIYQGIKIQPFYDSMIGKLIVHGKNRDEAIKKMQAALEELIVKGFSTNQSFLYLLIHHLEYIKGNFNTSFIERFKEALLEYPNECN